MHTPRSLLLCLLTLAACNDGGHRPSAQLDTGLAITTDIALDVASAAYRTAFDPVRVTRVLTRIFDLPPSASGPPASGQHTLEIEGPEGGNAVVTWQDRDGDSRYSTGDSFSIACADYGADGLLLTGAATFSEVWISGTVPTGLTWIVTAQLDLLGVTMRSGTNTTTLSGSYACHREQRATVRLLELEATGPAAVGMRTLAAGSGAARNDYALDFSQGLAALGTLTDAELGGTLDFRTETLLTGIQVMPDPVAGRLVVEGAANSCLWLVPLDFFTLELHVDADGDGEAETVIPTEWSEL